MGWLNLLLATSSLIPVEDALLIGAPDLARLVLEKVSVPERESKEFLSLAVEVEALNHNRQQMFAYWEKLKHLCLEAAFDSYLLEAMAWSEIEQGSNHPSLPLRLLSIFAASSTQDFRGVKLIRKAFDDPSSFTRSLAYTLSQKMGDECLKEGLRQRLPQEKDTQARSALIKAIGHLRMSDMKPKLEMILEKKECRDEEKEAAFQALIQLETTPSLEQVKRLLNHPKADLRALGCRLSLYLEKDLSPDLLLPLFNDPSKRVLLECGRVFGLLFSGDKRWDHVFKKALSILNDRTEKEALLIHLWLRTLILEKVEVDEWEFFVKQEEDIRLLATSFIGTAGKMGEKIRLNLFESSQDRFVKINLAWRILENDPSKEKALIYLSDQLLQGDSLWEERERGGISYLAPYQGRVLPPGISPQDIDHLNRINILSQIALHNKSEAEKSIKQFLSHRKVAIGILATTLMIKEGTEEMVQQVEQLLKDRSFPHQIEAAILLSLWQKDRESVCLLEESFKTADRRDQEIILEAIGRVATLESAPFFVERLKEPSPILRVLASLGLISCLNN